MARLQNSISFNSDLAEKLCDWFRENARPLPFRESHSPYHVWLSEIMLQQTQVKSVLPYYERFVGMFPDLFSLSQAGVGEVLKLWEGLGYYTRAINLHKAAKILVEGHGGQVPREMEPLLKLPGVGPYTAAAILSIAYNLEVPVLDGNVLRVYSRIRDLSESVDQGPVRRGIGKELSGLIPKGRAREFNQALMELGALVCTHVAPGCEKCPAHDNCLARHRGTVLERPVKKPRAKPTPIEVSMGVLTHQGKILVQKRLPEGLMAGLWEFPGGKRESGETPEETLAREFLEELEVPVVVGEKITVIRHAYTRFRVTLQAFFCSFKGAFREPVLHAATEARWMEPALLHTLAFPAADVKLIRLLEKRTVLP